MVLVDGTLVRQGTIPTLAELQAAVRRAFETKGIVIKENRNALKRVGPTEKGVGLPIDNTQTGPTPLPQGSGEIGQIAKGVPLSVLSSGRPNG